MSTNDDNRMNRKRVKGWMRTRAKEYDNSTQASEACADELNLCADDVDCTIPIYVFEVALDYFDDNGPKGK